MLARLAATLRGGQAGTGGLAAGLAPGEGATVVLDDNCSVRHPLQSRNCGRKLTEEIGDVMIPRDGDFGRIVPTKFLFPFFFSFLYCYYYLP